MEDVIHVDVRAAQAPRRRRRHGLERLRPEHDPAEVPDAEARPALHRRGHLGGGPEAPPVVGPDGEEAGEVLRRGDGEEPRLWGPVQRRHDEGAPRGDEGAAGLAHAR